MTFCPECGGEQHCPCNSCRLVQPINTVVWDWLDGDLISCGHCGFTRHVDEWLNIEYKQIYGHSFWP